MQDGFTANTTHGSTVHAVPACGGESGVAVYKGDKGGDGIGSTLDRKESPDGNRRHQRSGSSGSRRASLAQSQDRGNDFESVSNTDGMGPMARGRGGIQGVPDGTGPALSAAQGTAGRGGPIIGARCVSFRLAVRPGRTVPGSTPLCCPRHPAQVAVLASPHPSTGPLRYWSERDPQGGVLQRPEGADPEANSTNTTTPQSQPDARGPRDTGTTADPRGPGGAEDSGTILIAVLSTPAPGLTSDAVSTPEVPQGPVGRTEGRPLIISSSSSSLGGRRLAF
jgi:hypothetical protein